MTANCSNRTLGKRRRDQGDNPATEGFGKPASCAAQWGANGTADGHERPISGWLGAESGSLQIQQTVFVVDPDAAVRETIGQLVCMMNLRCELYESGYEFIRGYDPAQAGCVILELQIPRVSGLQIQEYLNTRKSLLPVIFLTRHATVSIAVRVMRCGALNVLEKPVRSHEIWDAIEEALMVNWQRLETRARREQDRALLESLTPKQRDVLLRLAEGKSRTAIAQELGVCLRTVDSRAKQLMVKLGASGITELVRFAMAIKHSQPEAENVEAASPPANGDGNHEPDG